MDTYLAAAPKSSWRFTVVKVSARVANKTVKALMMLTKYRVVSGVWTLSAMYLSTQIGAIKRRRKKIMIIKVLKREIRFRLM